MTNKISNNILKKILNKSFDEFFITDDKGVVLDVSSNSTELYGVNREYLIGQTVDVLEEEGILNPAVSKIVLSEKNIETRIQHTRTGEKVLVSAYPIFNRNGKITRVLSFSRNITDLEMLGEKNKKIAEIISLYETEFEKLSNRKGLFDEYQTEEEELLAKVADFNVELLIQGESGVGKTRFAQIVHEKSARKNMPFIEVNCGAIPESILEAELFGYEEGAFTGAKKGGKKGYFELANNGTILLDEISELPYHLQVNLLTVIQKRKITRLGGDKEIYLDCRIICATNKNLADLIKKRGFREDLYFRINVINIKIPPLRERKNEIMDLIDNFTKKFRKKHNMQKEFSKEYKLWMTSQEWPGNIRELRNYIEKEMILSDDDIISMKEINTSNSNEYDTEISLNQYMESVEKEYIIAMFQKYPSSLKLGKALGISQSTANRKIRQYIKIR